MADATIIYNPMAGPASFKSILTSVADTFRKRGWGAEIRPTEHAGHAIVLAAEAAQSGVELVVSVGGDGTLRETAGGVIGTETILATLPAGTGNSFAKELHMPRPGQFNPLALVVATERLLEGSVHLIDTAKIDGGGRWVQWAGTGIDSYLVSLMEPRPKWAKRLGPAGYVGEGLALAQTFPGMSATVDVDGRIFEGEFMMITVSNCQRYAGGEVELSPGAKLDDGEFEVWMFRSKANFTALRHLYHVARGTHVDDADVTAVGGKRVSIATEPPMPFHTDGDPAGTTPFSCHIVPASLRLLVPSTAPDGLFDQRGVALRSA